MSGEQMPFRDSPSTQSSALRSGSPANALTLCFAVAIADNPSADICAPRAQNPALDE